MKATSPAGRLLSHHVRLALLLRQVAADNGGVWGEAEVILFCWAIIEKPPYKSYESTLAEWQELLETGSMIPKKAFWCSQIGNPVAEGMPITSEFSSSPSDVGTDYVRHPRGFFSNDQVVDRVYDSICNCSYRPH